MNIKKLTLVISTTFVLTLLPSSREHEREITTHNLVDLWSNPSRDSNLRIRDVHDNTNHQMMQRNQVAGFELTSSYSSTSRHVVEPFSSSSSATRPIRAQDFMLPNMQAYVAHHTALSYQKAIKHGSALKFVQENKLAREIYQNVNARLQTISALVHSNNMHNRELIKHNLGGLRTAYDGLCHEYSQARLDLACKNYNDLVNGSSISQTGYAYSSSGERITCETAYQQLMILEQHTLAVHHLKSELNNLVDGLELALYKNGGGFLKEPRKEFDTLITDYQKQYAPGNSSMTEIPAYDPARFARIEHHRSNVAINGINRYLADGNLAAAEEVVHKYNRTWSQKKYKEPVRECLRTNPQLNELGIPRICADTNPRWDAYKEQLLARPDNKSVIAQQMYQEHIAVQDLCKRVGIENASSEHLRQAHQLLEYKNDTIFLDHAGKALRDPKGFTNYLRIFEQRAQATNIIRDAIKQYPGSERIFRTRGNELLCYAGDPDFANIINEIAYDPSRIQEMRDIFVKRNDGVIEFQRKLEYQEYPTVITDMAYDLISAQNVTQQVGILSALAADSANRDMYQIYYDPVTHLPKIYTYDGMLMQDARAINLPSSLGTQEYSSERMLYTQVMVQPITSDMQREQAQQYLQTLKHACTPHEHQNAYRTLSHFAGQMYLHPSMQSSSAMQQQNIALCNNIKSSIECGDLTTAANNMSMLQHEVQQSDSSIAIPEQVQNFIQQHATLTIAEATHAASSNTQSNSAVHDYGQLLAQVQTQHAAMFQQTGIVSEYYRSRENALAMTAAGDLSIREISYTLSPQAHMALEKAGIDVEQFATCTGNALQQDTHAKLVNTLNTLADARPITVHGNLIRKGALDCAQTGNILNQGGHVREAMTYADLCTLVVEKALHFADAVSPFVTGRCVALDATTMLLHAASAHDLARSLDTLRANVDEFRTGLVVGAIQGVTDFKGIYDGLCNTITTIKHFAEFVADQFILADAIEFGRYDEARRILAANHERYVRITTGANYLGQLAAAFVEHMPDMTPQEWRQAGVATGQFAGREAVQFGTIKAGITGLSKLTQGIAQATKNFDTIAKEIALSAQFTGAPATTPNVAARLYRIENVVQHDGTHFVHAMPNPESVSRVILNEGVPAVRAGAEIVAESSDAASHIAALRKFGKQLSETLTEVKPGFLQLPGSSESVLFSALKTLMRTEIEQYGTVTLATAQKMWDSSQEFNELNNRVAELLRSTTDTKCGKVVPDTASAIKQLQADEIAHNFYEQMRITKSDIDTIAQHTGIDRNIIEKIKNHVFYEKHILKDGTIGQFAPCENMAVAWNRLMTGNFVQSDLRLLQHEFAESLLVNGQELAYEAVHPTVNEVYNWFDNL